MSKRKTFRRQITSPELTAHINKKNILFMERYLKHMSTTRSPKTVLTYRSNLTIFFTWNLLDNDNKFFCNVKKYDLMAFFDYAVTELQWNSYRYNTVHSTLSSFSTWIENYFDDDFPNFRNLLPKIERLDVEAVRQKSVFTKQELDGLMNWLGSNCKRNEQCLLALAMASGARASELVRFKTSMIKEDHTAFDGLFLETAETMQVKGRGTHGKQIVRYIIKDLFMPYYESWMPVRDRIMTKFGKCHTYLFVTRHGDPLTVAGINYWIKDWDNVLNKHFYPHSMRHFWTSYLLKAGLEKELIQQLQAWSTDALVDVYNDNSIKDREWRGLDKLKKTLEVDKENRLKALEQSNKPAAKPVGEILLP